MALYFEYNIFFFLAFTTGVLQHNKWMLGEWGEGKEQSLCPSENAPGSCVLPGQDLPEDDLPNNHLRDIAFADNDLPDNDYLDGDLPGDHFLGGGHAMNLLESFNWDNDSIKDHLLDGDLPDNKVTVCQMANIYLMDDDLQ
uniref:Putative secreted protein n=1 Tax=Ixodes ricinus TaxID=34613 RepID=A0A6B0UTV8_IXORI